MPAANRTPERTADRIEKSIEIKAPISRVWRALTHHDEFGAWFRVALDAPFKVGEVAAGKITWPGYEHIVWRATIQSIDPEQYFAFTWHPYAVDPHTDYSKETPTLVEFHLEKTATGTLLKVTESGFSDIPDQRRGEAFLRNSEGWQQQMKNIEEYVAQHP
ncbi:MAG TPA: SRPBCC family protein [Acidobacteriaceae bacterium]|nr:SRPBCC family protein [Acidobacteriaceae bacterium]